MVICKTTLPLYFFGVNQSTTVHWGCMVAIPQGMENQYIYMYIWNQWTTGNTHAYTQKHDYASMCVYIYILYYVYVNIYIWIYCVYMHIYVYAWTVSLSIYIYIIIMYIYIYIYRLYNIYIYICQNCLKPPIGHSFQKALLSKHSKVATEQSESSIAPWPRGKGVTVAEQWRHNGSGFQSRLSPMHPVGGQLKS
jgi:hypothetical protein